MREIIPLIRAVGCLILLGGISACSTPGPRTRYLEQVRPANFTNLVAYRTDTNLEIRIPLYTKDAYAHTSWVRAQTGGSEYQTRLAVLTFDPEHPGARKTTVNRNNLVAIRTPAQWRQLVQRILEGIAPADPRHGVLLLVENEEIVVYRDSSNKVAEIRLESKPSEIQIDHTYNDTDFSHAAIHLLETGVVNLDRQQWQFLFATGGSPGFVFVDLRQRLVVFIDYPGDPETQEVSASFAMRALNSLVVKSFLVTAVKNPVTLVARGFWHLGTSGAAAITVASGGGPGPPPSISTGPGMDLPTWENNLDHLTGGRRYKGKLDLLIDGEKFFPALIESVEGAKKSVNAEVFIFDTDDYAVKIADLLKKRSAQVKVRVLMDDVGSLFAGNLPHPSLSGAEPQDRPSDIGSYLTAGSKIEVRASANPWLTVDHRKCIIIDGVQAYVGGMNIGRDYRYDWHDMMVGLTGPIVGSLEKSYEKAWVHAGPSGDFGYAWISLFEPSVPRRNRMTNGIDIRPLRTATFRADIYRAQLEAIRRCKSYIYIENAYFEDNAILGALIEARRRGVDVRVVFPAENDSGIMQTGEAIVGNALLANGARVYVFPGMTHIKAAIYDGWACLGSANFNKMSLRVGQELDVAFSDPTTVTKLRTELFERDFKKSKELTKPVPVEWYDSFVKAFADQL